METREHVVDESPGDVLLPAGDGDDLVGGAERMPGVRGRFRGRRLFVNTLIALGAVICLVFGVVALSGDSGTAPTIRTGTVTTGTVSSTVSASGNVQSPGSVNANFQSGGQLVGVYVSVGQHVEVGQALAMIDDTVQARSLAAARSSAANAQSNLASAQAHLTQVQQSLDLPAQQQAVATAQQGVTNAVVNAQNDSTVQQNSVTQARNTFDTDNDTADTDCGKSMSPPPAAPAVVPAPAAQPSSPTDPDTCPAAWTKVTGDYWALASAQSNQYQKVNADYQSIQNAQNQLTSAEISLETAQEGNPASLASAQSSVVSAQSSVVSAQSNVASAQKTEDETTLYAVQAGTVSAVTAAVGDNVSGGGSSSSSTGSSSSDTSGSTGATGATGATSSSSSSASSSGTSSGFITITDDSGGLQVKAGFSESDVANVKVGQPASVTFSALTGTTTPGKVAAIDSESTVTSNVVTYNVTIALDQAPADVKPGMTATATVTTAEKADVTRVVSAAVTGRGTSGSVTVIKKGKQTPTVVGVGLRGDSFTEITSGLSSGQTIVVSTSTGSFTGGGTGTGTGAGTGTGFPGGGLGGGLGGGSGGGAGGGPAGAGPAGAGGR